MNEKRKNIIIGSLFLIFIIIIAVVIMLICFAGDNNVDKTPTIDEMTSNTEDITDVTVQKPQNTTQAETISTEKQSEIQTDNTNITDATMSVSIATDLLTEPITTPITQLPTENLTNPQTVPTEITPTEPPTQSNDTDELISIISSSGYSLENIEEQNINQIVIADTYGSQADIYLFTKNGDIWVNENLDCTGYIGSAGIGEKQNSFDNITPYGLYSIKDAFYINEQPSTWLNTFRITEDTYWVDDVESSIYNQKTEGEQDWKSAIHMIDFPEYEYGCVIGYNTDYPAEKSMGAGIFMNCGSSPTNGSIALPKDNMISYLNILNSGKNPYILIF